MNMSNLNMEKFNIGDRVYLDFGISGIIPDAVIIAVHDFGNYSSYDIDIVVKECSWCGQPSYIPTGEVQRAWDGINARICFVESQFIKHIK